MPLPEEKGLSIAQRLAAILRSDPAVNGVVALAIVVGFIHGWLKVRFRHPAVTFAFDGMLGLALAFVFARMPRRSRLFPLSPTSKALLAFYVVCGFYLFLPWGPPILVSVAACRGWCFASLMFLLGYHLTSNIAQVKGYFYFLVILGIGVAAYGFQQSPDEIERLMKDDPEFAQRYITTYYTTSKGGQMRVFSTFVSAGAFGGTLAYVAVFCLALLSARDTPKRERWALAACLVPLAYGIVLSGSRTALLTLLCGLCVIAWFRRNVHTFVLTPLAILVAIRLGTQFTGGHASERFSTIWDLQGLYYRHAIPFEIGWGFMMENPLGGGLGKSGYSIPFFLSGRTGYSDFVAADGDVGRLMIDLGWIGLIFFGRLLYTGLKSAYFQLKEVQDTPVASIALASGACFAMSVVGFPSGSPFLGIPMGAMTWFFLGTLQKLHDEHKKGAFASAPLKTESQPTGKRFLYYHPPRGNSRAKQA